jgi:hypothetical protein
MSGYCLLDGSLDGGGAVAAGSPAHESADPGRRADRSEWSLKLTRRYRRYQNISCKEEEEEEEDLLTQ